ncbi:hypothetical protein [Rhodococcus sp. UNC363MFTsu5.1]|uniref:hypothetical protein n=1 Tax=Rhodococcus sp. UNC363MFTsu5.1 TaxID=1449069 RepID=UPI000480C289|nr:hypothetical protein [Rhodococcus sp. UNC363MFTsu5.1]
MTTRARFCTSCEAPIFFATTPGDEQMPVEVEPRADGNVHVTFSDPPTARVVGRGQAEGMRAAGIQLYRSHFASCPKANQHRHNPRTTRKGR